MSVLFLNTALVVDEGGARAEAELERVVLEQGLALLRHGYFAQSEGYV